jgi:hypothetical protein
MSTSDISNLMNAVNNCKEKLSEGEYNEISEIALKIYSEVSQRENKHTVESETGEPIHAEYKPGGGFYGPKAVIFDLIARKRRYIKLPDENIPLILKLNMISEQASIDEKQSEFSGNLFEALSLTISGNPDVPPPRLDVGQISVFDFRVEYEPKPENDVSQLMNELDECKEKLTDGEYKRMTDILLRMYKKPDSHTSDQRPLTQSEVSHFEIPADVISINPRPQYTRDNSSITHDIVYDRPGGTAIVYGNLETAKLELPGDLVHLENESGLVIQRFPGGISMKYKFFLNEGCVNNYLIEYEKNIHNTKRIYHVENDQLHGQCMINFDDGRLVQQYNRGEREGKSIVYEKGPDMRLRVVREYNFHNDKMHGLQIKYFYNGNEIAMRHCIYDMGEKIDDWDSRNLQIDPVLGVLRNANKPIQNRKSKSKCSIM